MTGTIRVIFLPLFSGCLIVNAKAQCDEHFSIALWMCPGLYVYLNWPCFQMLFSYRKRILNKAIAQYLLWVHLCTQRSLFVMVWSSYTILRETIVWPAYKNNALYDALLKRTNITGRWSVRSSDHYLNNNSLAEMTSVSRCLYSNVKEISYNNK